MIKILIIDDDIDLCAELADMFETDGFSVSSTSERDRAEEFISGGDFDILLLDYKMFGMTGVDILKMLKTRSFKREVFLVSGRPFIDKLLKEENLSDMVRKIIPKPLDCMNLLQEVKKAAQEIQSQRP